MIEWYKNGRDIKEFEVIPLDTEKGWSGYLLQLNINAFIFACEELRISYAGSGFQILVLLYNNWLIEPSVHCRAKLFI